MPSKKATQKKAVEKRTQERLAAKRDSAQRGAEPHRRKQEEQAPVQAGPARENVQESPAAAEAKRQAELKATAPPAERAGGPMVTVALRG